MLKGRGRDPRGAVPPTPTPSHHNMRTPVLSQNTPSRSLHTPQMPRSMFVKPEPDYEVVEFPSEQYVNAKLQPPPPPPPRPPTGHPADAGASCGLCGGGGARVRCAECGRRALCASCDDMYHRHPKRRNHQRQAISLTQLRDERPPLPPKATAPVPPPRRHKLSNDRLSASPKPPSSDQLRSSFNHISPSPHGQPLPINNHSPHARQQYPLHLQAKLSSTQSPSHVGSMPYLPATMHHGPAAVTQNQGHHTLGHMNSAWNRPRGSLQAFNFHQPPVTDAWEPEVMSPMGQNWTRPLRRGASVLELGGGATTCPGCAQCAPTGWRYGSCANLDHPWQNVWQPTCCVGPQQMPQAQHLDAHLHTHPHHVTHTPQPHRRTYENRSASRTASRAGSRAASPAVSVRSRTLRRNKHRTPSPPPVPSSDADSESDSDSDIAPPETSKADNEDSLGPAPPPSESSWQCEHCTFVNEPGVRVCVVCCRTPTVAPKIIVTDIREDVEKLKIHKDSTSAILDDIEGTRKKHNGVRRHSKTKLERASTGCGSSPPRTDEKSAKATTERLKTPPHERNDNDHSKQQRERHDMAVGPSPPREIMNGRESKQSTASGPSPPREATKSVKISAIKEPKESPKVHSISVGPSPPRENINMVHSTIGTNSSNQVINIQKKSTGTSPPRTAIETKHSSTTTKMNVSNTGTSPPPQSISTQTYETPSTWERAPSVSRSRPRRRFRDDARRDRSQSRHSVSSDTRDSDLSIRTAGANGRWEWRDRSPGEDWSGSSRISRRASHLDLRRSQHRRSGFYGSEAASPEPSSCRAGSVEALTGAGVRRGADRGLELARLMAEAEKQGFSAVEVQAALAQSPAAPLAWLRSRWPSLCAGVRAAAARLAPDVAVSEMDARSALARHRGAMWPAVTDCIERYRRQTGAVDVSEEGRLRGRVWGSPAGADDDSAPRGSSRRSSRVRAEDSSDEYEALLRPKIPDDWMHLPMDVNVKLHSGTDGNPNLWSGLSYDVRPDNLNDITLFPPTNIETTLIDEKVLQNLLSDNTIFNLGESADILNNKLNPFDLVQSENDFIEAYNALAKTNPLPNIHNFEHTPIKRKNVSEVKQNTYDDIDIDNVQPEIQNNMQVIRANVPKDPPLKKSTQINKSNTKHTEVSSNLQEKGKETLVTEKHIITKTISELKLPSVIDNAAYSEFHKKENNIAVNNYDEQTEEKSKKFNDIVDNTQKLIQQMKEEINLDIDSLDSRNISQSEHESSSNDEQESSYSDTESRTDIITSDEKELSSTDTDELKQSEQKKNPSLIQRTSSEDNEQFEEALDNLENQISDYTDANIEILDSIARGLQEDHTLEIKETENTDLRKQDFNNNLFIAVNSFEEIYEELNSSNSFSVKNQQPIMSQTNHETVSNILPNIDLLPKQAINILSLKLISPTKIIVSEYKQPIFNAKLDMVEEHQDSAILVEPSDNNKVEKSKTMTNELTNVEQAMTRKQSQSPVFSNLYDNINIVSKTSASKSLLNNTTTPFIDDDSDKIINTLQGNQEEVENKTSNIEISEKQLNENFDFKNSEQNTENINIENEKVATVDNSNKLVATKSNIPKPIRISPNNKGKLEKNLPKLIVSKVPIRRSSIKQYPAPPAPPNSHFRNIQSGNVKQLQTRLFNAKSKINTNTVETSEPNASTSTIAKKKPAPPPPIKSHDPKQTMPQNLSPPKDKKSYFRETCRTEDEWTESDSEDSQIQVIRPTEEQEQRPLSPPPPITLRSISGQLIDLAKVRLPEGSPERQARMLLAEGATETWEQAQLAVELVIRGTESSAALMAALECMDLTSALAYLNQECELCASRFPEHEMVSMLRCTHRCCRECAHHYFTVQITERSIVDCICPYCKAPDLENIHEDAWLEYFAHLDILLKTLLETEVHELFQRKLRDRTLARDPNFRWCMECSSGFFVHPKQKKLRCPECRSISCASCRKPWSANHEGLTCEQYAAWVEDNDPERSVSAIQQHLRDNGLECPRCHFKYSLSRGGCMHFTCTQCKYEFCYGCGKPFTMGAQCGLSDYCAKLGLHAHHPRNCLFYLRDKEPHELQTLLQMNNVQYETNPTADGNGRCPIQLQRETPTGLIDGICGSEAPTNFAGLCKAHYVEYLAGLARKLDPIPIMDVPELVAELRRRALPLPERGPWDTDPIYAGMCAEIVREKIPLD